MLTVVNKFSALELCERGDYEAAAELLGIRAGEWPENVSGSDSERAEAVLAAGGIASTLAGIQQTGSQVEARKMLDESIRLFGDDPRAWVARSWLACADYWDGAFDDALVGIEQVLDSPVDGSTRFRTLLLKVMIRTDQRVPDLAYADLRDLEPLYEEACPLLKGKFHLQRGRLLRMTGETDRAIVEYDGAIDFFQQACDIRHQAIAANNLAGVYLETRQFPEAHQYAKQARRLFRQLGDKTHEAQTWDQSAQVYLAESKLDEAESAITQGITLVEFGTVLIECEETLGKIKQAQVTYLKDDNAKISDAPSVLPNPTPRERSGHVMTPYDCAQHLIKNDSENAAVLLDLLIWVSSVQDDNRHEAELDKIERMLFSRVPECEAHRAEYRRRRIVRPVTSVDS